MSIAFAARDRSPLRREIDLSRGARESLSRGARESQSRGARESLSRDPRESQSRGARESLDSRRFCGAKNAAHTLSNFAVRSYLRIAKFSLIDPSDCRL